MIKNSNYTDPEILKEEQNKIFHESWFYVGLKEKLVNKNDFITYSCGEVSLFVQNFGDKLKAFSNICLHRFNNIHQSNEGNGMLVCSYHNWVYNDNGEPIVGFPCLKEELNKCERNRLEEYDVDSCGEFVFVKINNNSTITLKEQLDSFYPLLENLSSHFDHIINKETIVLDHKSNWKLLVENVLECYHCSSVHKETLVPMGIGSKKPEGHFYEKGNDKIDYPMRKTSTQAEREEKLPFLGKTTYLHKSLQHWFIYPNLFITSTAGNLFYVGRMMPNTANNTQLHTQFVKPTYTELSKKESIVLNAYATASIDSAQKVIFEDREILELIQQNMEIIPKLSQIFGEEEFRIKLFHDKITELINYK